jgi:hypothetical protein
MVSSAVAVVIFGIVLKLIAAEPGSVVLVPLAAIAGLYHVSVHREASRSPNPPVGLAAISDILMLSALLMQIDFSYSYNCGHTTIDGVSWILGWSSEYRCTLIRGVPAVILDATYYIPVAVTWWRLRARSVFGRPDLAIWTRMNAVHTITVTPAISFLASLAKVEGEHSF